MNQNYSTSRRFVAAVFSVLGLCAFTSPQSASSAELTCTALGICYCVTPEYKPKIDTQVKKARKVLAKHREDGDFIAYISIPLTNAAGSDNELDQEVSASIKQRLMSKYGDGFWALAPGTGLVDLPDKATDGDWMYMWTRILGGEKGVGEDFDAVFFTGPEGFLNHMGVRGNDLIGQLKAFAKKRATTNQSFARKIAPKGALRDFVSNYAFRSSVAFSEGCHDEWNIFHAINQNRRAQSENGILTQLSVFFDGKAVDPAAYATPISRGAQSNVCE